MVAYSIIYFFVSMLWLYIFHRGTKLKTSIILQAFAIGMVSAICAAFISLFLKREFIHSPSPAYGATSENYFIFTDFFLYFFIVGPIEEGSKFLALFLLVIRKKTLKNPIEVLLLGVTIALGFAGLENILYLAMYGLESTLPRLLLANLGHAAFSIYWSYALGVVLFEKAPQTLLIAGLFISAIAHGAYDYFLGFSLAVSLISFILATVLISFMVKFIGIEKKRQN